MVIGYTTGVFDLFHVGHVRLLKNAKSLCDHLIVGVTVDELVSYKNKKSVIPFEERAEIVAACEHVDLVVPQATMDKLEAHQRYKFDLMFVGDDWFKTKKWEEFDRKFQELSVKVIFFPFPADFSFGKPPLLKIPSL